jgi:hypothetical protein
LNEIAEVVAPDKALEGHFVGEVKYEKDNRDIDKRNS